MKDLECLQRAVDYIEKNICNPINVAKVANYAYISERILTELFRSIAGYSVIEYIRKRRLTLVAYDIRRTGDKIIDISMKYYYESQESFSRAFRRFHGISPQHFPSQKISQKELGEIKFINNNVVGEDIGAGYRVLENGPIYYTNDMDAIVAWFRNVLGWVANIDARSKSGEGTFGCAMPIPEANVSEKLTSFMGFSLFYGEPLKRVVGYITVDHVDNIRNFIQQSGWTEVPGIVYRPWGARECSVTTPDGGTITFSSYDMTT